MQENRSTTKWFQRGKRFVYFGVVLMSLVLAGCGTLQTLVQKDGETSPLSQWIGGNEKAVPATTNLGDGKTVSLYFPDQTGKYLVKEERTIPKTLSLARETVAQWLKGPAVKGTGLAPVAPGTTLLDIAIKDGVAIVDLSKEFTQPVSKVSQEVAVYGLVNTLTQFPTVREVKLRIEGKALTKLGPLDLSHLGYREGLVKSTTSGNSQEAIPNTGDLGTSSNSNAHSGTKPNANANSGSGVSVPVLPDSPSTINLFSVPAHTS